MACSLWSSHLCDCFPALMFCSCVKSAFFMYLSCVFFLFCAGTSFVSAFWQLFPVSLFMYDPVRSFSFWFKPSDSARLLQFLVLTSAWICFSLHLESSGNVQFLTYFLKCHSSCGTSPKIFKFAVKSRRILGVESHSSQINLWGGPVT